MGFKPEPKRVVLDEKYFRKLPTYDGAPEKFRGWLFKLCVSITRWTYIGSQWMDGWIRIGVLPSPATHALAVTIQASACRYGSFDILAV